MYKVTVWRKHLIQVELDNVNQIDLINRTFNKLMVWTDPPMFELQEGMVFGFMAYTTKQNLKHMFDMIGVSNKPYTDDLELKPYNNHAKNFIIRLYFDRKFIGKKMSRKNYLPTVKLTTRDQIEDILRRLTGVGLDHKWVKKPKRSKSKIRPEQNKTPIKESNNNEIVIKSKMDPIKVESKSNINKSLISFNSITLKS